MILTHEQIDDLTGRDLDAAVAVTLFGWEWQRKIKSFFPPRNLNEPHLCALQPPDPDPHGYERVNYFAPHWEPVASCPGPEERFSDWHRAAVRRNDRGNTVEWELPHFSDGTDMNATWRVVEAMKKRSCYITLNYYNDSEAEWNVSFYTRNMQAGGHFLEGDAENTHLALAICRAALHALAQASE